MEDKLYIDEITPVAKLFVMQYAGYEKPGKVDFISAVLGDMRAKGLVGFNGHGKLESKYSGSINENNEMVSELYKNINMNLYNDGSYKNITENLRVYINSKLKQYLIENGYLKIPENPKKGGIMGKKESYDKTQKFEDLVNSLVNERLELQRSLDNDEISLQNHGELYAYPSILQDSIKKFSTKYIGGQSTFNKLKSIVGF